MVILSVYSSFFNKFIVIYSFNSLSNKHLNKKNQEFLQFTYVIVHIITIYPHIHQKNSQEEKDQTSACCPHDTRCFSNPSAIVSRAIASCKQVIIDSGLDVRLVCFCDDEFSGFKAFYPHLKELFEETKGEVIDAR